MEEVESVATASSLRLKFVAPALAMEPIERPRVLSRLVASTHARLLLLCAPAGFSKTITLGQYACARQTQGWDVLWLSLEAQDNQPSHFISRLINAFAEVKAEQGDAARALLEQQPPLAVAEVMERLLADMFQCLKPTLLVLDDAQVIQQPELLAALNRMVSLAPANFTVALACRSLPALNLATLRAKGMLTELGVDELKFTLGESQALFQQRSIALDAQQLEPLFNDTEGWPMALQQACLWLQNQPNLQAQAVSQLLSGVPGVDDYVQRTVFEPLSAELQDALLTLGVSRQICGDLANTLMGRQDGQQLLEQLESLQLFLLPLDRSRHWYRFHPVFAEYLRTRLRAQNPERFKQLHFNASLWFTNHHMLNLALEHAHQAEDPQMLAALLDACGLELINRGQLGLIYKWRKQVPDAIAEGYPVLVMADVWTRASEMGLGEANRLLDGLLSRWSAPAGASAFNDQVLASLAIKTVIALQKDDLDTCITLARRIEMQLGKSSAFLEVAILIVGALALMVQGQHDAASKMLALAQQRNHFLEGRYLDLQVLNVEMLLALEQGHSKRAQLLCEQLTERFKPWFAHRSRAMVLPMISEALIDYSQGRFDGLPERLRWALDKVDVINPIDLNAQAMLCLARVQRLQDATRESAATLILMQNLAARYHSWRFYAQAVGEEIALILQEPAADRTKRAEQRLKSVNWAKLASAYQHREFNPVLWVQSLTRIRLQQARGHYSEALHEIAQLKTQLQGAPYPLHMLRLDLLSALSYQRLGYQERAQSLLLQCLVDAEREELRSLFMEEGEAIRQMLQQLESAERHPGMQGFLRSILSIWPGREAQQLADALEDGLTEREREVVCLAAKGLSNEEISQQLSLALGTVKWHLHNIYEKLKVRNRTQAIRRARELSLLES